jgi:hypothetical protein
MNYGLWIMDVGNVDIPRSSSRIQDVVLEIPSVLFRHGYTNYHELELVYFM